MNCFENYIKKYANCFNLYYGENTCYNKQGEKVLFLNEDKTVSYRMDPLKWSKCKQGDLLVSIINNIPIHE